MTRMEAVNWLNNIMSDIGKSQHRELWHYEQALAEIRELLEEDSQWIPCSERLPKYPYRVQIQLDNGWIITGYYSEEHWYTVPHCGGFLMNDEVEAWRELPKPY